MEGYLGERFVTEVRGFISKMLYTIFKTHHLWALENSIYIVEVSTVQTAPTGVVATWAKLPHFKCPCWHVSCKKDNVNKKGLTILALEENRFVLHTFDLT